MELKIIMEPEVLDKSENNQEFKFSWDFWAYYIFIMAPILTFRCANACSWACMYLFSTLLESGSLFSDHQPKHLNFFTGQNKGLATWELFYFYNFGKANVID